VRRTGGEDISTKVLGGSGPPDLSAVDTLARMALAASRKGSVVVLSEVSQRLRELLVLAGLRLEMSGEAEIAEEALGVRQGQEEAERGDLPR
jgi:hypothetical protein